VSELAEDGGGDADRQRSEGRGGGRRGRGGGGNFGDKEMVKRDEEGKVINEDVRIKEEKDRAGGHSRLKSRSRRGFETGSMRSFRSRGRKRFELGVRVDNGRPFWSDYRLARDKGSGRALLELKPCRWFR
jgi:hypothetical protein